MDTQLECLPCFCRQALEAARFVTDDPSIQEQVLRSALRTAGEIDLRISPPEMAQRMHAQIRELTGDPDPYREAKRRANRTALALYPTLRDRLHQGDPLETALRLAIAGNVIDLAIHPTAGGDEMAGTVEAAARQPLEGAGIETFRRAVEEAGDILFLGDNAGEIVFDRFLIEQLPLDKITYVVKSRPIINDATMEDAQAAGLIGMVEVIANGSDAPGTILGLCSDEFRQRFDRAALIIAKGQANYESLSGTRKPTLFLLMAKCPAVSRRLGCEIGTLVLRADNLHGGCPPESNDEDESHRQR